MSTTRAFIAVVAPPAMCKRAEQLANKLRKHAANINTTDSNTADIKWVNSANFHWTLQFLGEVDDTDLAKVCDAVARAAQRSEPFPLAALGAGAFPSPERPRVLWIGAGQGTQQMVDLQDAIAEELAAVGFGTDNRPYVPHLTLGRAGRTSRPADWAEVVAKFSDFDAGAMRVEKVVVLGSEPTREGPCYHKIGRAPLQSG